MRPIVTDVVWSVDLHVCLSVYVLVTHVSPARTTVMLFVGVDLWGPEESSITWDAISP